MIVFLKGFKYLFIFCLLSIFTQIGGIIYLLLLLLTYRYPYKSLRFASLFLIVYLLITLGILPFITPFFGRVPLPLTGNLRPLNYMTCLLNRHYVKPALKEKLTTIATKMEGQFEGNTLNYLDANFPFFDGFPLLPHLSHNDGRKVDLAFFYNTASGERSNQTPSFIGYGVYEAPLKGEVNYPHLCKEKGFWQYGFLAYLVPQWHKKEYLLDVKRTQTLIRLLAKDELTSKVFIEPHLTQRWQVAHLKKIRFHGCHAVRHDDHIHYQIR